MLKKQKQSILRLMRSTAKTTPAPVCEHIFIGGCGRSGTTMTGCLFRNHPHIIYFGEPGLFIERGAINDFLNGTTNESDLKEAVLGSVSHRLHKKLSAHNYTHAVAAYSHEAIDGVIRRSLDPKLPRMDQARILINSLFSVGAKAEGKIRWAEKTPLSVTMTDTLYALFPDMRYIHMIREPTEVCASLMRQSWGPKNLSESIDLYTTVMTKALSSYQHVPKSQYVTLSLERLAQNPLPITERLFELCSLEVNSDIAQKAIADIDAERALAKRGSEQLSPEEIKQAESSCLPIYRKWLQNENDCAMRMEW